MPTAWVEKSLTDSIDDFDGRHVPQLKRPRLYPPTLRFRTKTSRHWQLTPPHPG